MAREHRRLAAIVSIDVAGYSALMGMDEAGTLVALKSHRADLVDTCIADHSGRIVKTTGDGLLVEFGSVVDALQCAVTVQRRMAERNSAVPPDRRIVFRIGINVGDIIIDGDDIYGDGVNVAARLESIAEPGGIFVSGVVRDQVAKKLGVPFDDLGLKKLKNIAEPVRVFRVGFDVPLAAPVGTRIRASLKRGGWRVVGYGAAAVAALGIALGIWINTRSSIPSVDAPESAPPWSIAVLPFRSPPGNASLASLADGVSNDLSLTLANSMRYARIVAPGSAGEPRKFNDSRALGVALNVRYLIDGELQPMRDGVLVTMRIVETNSATQIGGERREMIVSRWDSDRGAFIAAMTGATRDAVGSAEVRRASAGKATDTPADLVRQGLARMDGTLANTREARKFYDRALQVDPRYVEAWIGRGWTFTVEFDEDWTDSFDRDRVVRELDEASRRATDLDDRDPRAWRLRAIALADQYRWSGALEAIERGRLLDPTRREFSFQKALVFQMTARPAEVLRVVEEEMRLGGSFEPHVLRLACRAHLALGQYDEAIGDCERAVAVVNHWTMFSALTAAYSLKGDMTKAAIAKAQLLQSTPGFTISRWRQKRTSNHPEYLNHLETVIYPALIKAGVPP